MIERFYGHVKELGHKLSTPKSDNGTEFVNEAVKEFARGKFTLRTTPTHTPQANGISERFNRTLIEKIQRPPLPHRLLLPHRPPFVAKEACVAMVAFVFFR
jgi:transposase InsO family protein